ncbi:MAG: Uma2 family endonuclease [Gemmatimonadaceae bacterium]|nr:Uma2 family endonuclease [Gemmatimonadaceae bacterium]
MPAITPAQKYWRPDDVWALPDDGKRYECIDGELLVSPAPRARHQVALGELFAILRVFVMTHRVGVALMAPSDLRDGDRALVQPDLHVHRTPPTPHDDESTLTQALLCVEILSPSTARYDRKLKRSLYQRIGVSEYWIVDADAHLVERWRPGDERPEVLSEELAWNPAGASAPLFIDLRTLFAEVDRLCGALRVD